MKKNKLLLPVMAVLMTTAFYSCKESDTSKLQNAQLCLNTASSATAMGCVNDIASDGSPIAYSLRCSAVFIAEGFGSAVNFVDALKSINEAPICSGCSSTLNVLNSFKFVAADVSTVNGRQENNDAAAYAFSQCSQADAKIYTQIASLFKLGTLTSMLAYQNVGSSYSPTDLAAQIQNLTPADVGAIVTVTYTAACNNLDKASDETKKYCAELKTAIDGGTTETEIGQCLMEKLQNPSYTGPLCTP